MSKKCCNYLVRHRDRPPKCRLAEFENEYVGIVVIGEHTPRLRGMTFPSDDVSATAFQANSVPM